jgi:HEPN domain-containing protein
MNDRTSHGRAWLAKAGSDLAAARLLLEVHGPADIVCFHAQQAAEKLLKAILASSERPIPRTHNLEELEAACREVCSERVNDELSRLGLSELTPYAVEARYDLEFWPEEELADAAVRTAERLRDIVRSALGASEDPDPA